MMFKTTTAVALIAALMSSAQAAVLNSGSTLEAREEPCPVSGNSCGWFLLNREQPCTTVDELRRLNSLANPWDSIWTIKDGKPVAFVIDCVTGCSQQGTGRPKTVCNKKTLRFA